MASAPPPSAQATALLRRLQMTNLDNAGLAIRNFSALKTLMAAQLAPCVSVHSIINLFNAANTFAVPILRAARDAQRHVDAEDVLPLPLWPDWTAISTVSMASSCNAHIGVEDAEVSTLNFSVEEIKGYATKVLQVLDLLSLLHAVPLGESAKARLKALATKYKLREVSNGMVDPVVYGFHPTRSSDFVLPGDVNTFSAQERQHSGSETTTDHLHYLAPHSPSSTAALPTLDLGPLDSFGGLTSGPSADNTFLSELLALDPSIWETLLEPEVPPHARRPG